MGIFRDTADWEQKLLVTFRAHRRDLREIAEDVMRALPSATLKCAGATPEAGSRPDLMDVGIELPDDATMLNRVMAVVFRAQGNLRPAIKVQRVLRGAADDGAPHACQSAAALAAAA